MENDSLNGVQTTAVLLVAAIAAVVSFLHIEHLAITHGQERAAAVLLPVSIDGTVAAASLVMLRAARARLPIPALARFMLALSVTATLAANVAYGAPFGLTGALISGWPAVAFVGCVEMSIGMVRRVRRVPAGHIETVPAAAPEPVAADDAAPDATTVTAPPAAPDAAPSLRQRATPARHVQEPRGPAGKRAEGERRIAANPSIGATELARAVGVHRTTADRWIRAAEAQQDDDTESEPAPASHLSLARMAE